MFSHFGTVPACDGRTDGQTHDDSIYRTASEVTTLWRYRNLCIIIIIKSQRPSKDPTTLAVVRLRVSFYSSKLSTSWEALPSLLRRRRPSGVDRSHARISKRLRRRRLNTEKRDWLSDSGRDPRRLWRHVDNVLCWGKGWSSTSAGVTHSRRFPTLLHRQSGSRSRCHGFRSHSCLYRRQHQSVHQVVTLNDDDVEGSHSSWCPANHSRCSSEVMLFRPGTNLCCVVA